jgi:hypothetical protein
MMRIFEPVDAFTVGAGLIVRRPCAAQEQPMKAVLLFRCPHEAADISEKQAVGARSPHLLARHLLEPFDERIDRLLILRL